MSELSLVGDLRVNSMTHIGLGGQINTANDLTSTIDPDKKNPKKNPVDKTPLKPLNDVASLSLVATGIVQSPEQISLFPETLKDIENSTHSIPLASKIISKPVVNAANFLEHSKVVSIATGVSHNTVVVKTSSFLGKASPYLNSVVCTYSIAKSVAVLYDRKETDSHKLKAGTQVALNAVNGVSAFKGPQGMVISAVAGFTSLGVDLFWK